MSADRALDYLFQESPEEQVESLRQLQNGSEQRGRLLQRISQWFRAE